jgi:DNA modification methylase
MSFQFTFGRNEPIVKLRPLFRFKFGKTKPIVRLFHGNCLDILKTFKENSFDAILTDPPYHLTSIVKRFGKKNSAPAKFGTDGAYRRAAKGFMGKTWDGGDIAFRPQTWKEILRVLKPGGHMVAFASPKNSHRMICAIEDAGFEIRDCLMWIYGTGFPKSHNVSKGIDKLFGVKQKVIGSKIGLPGYSLKENDTDKHNRHSYSKFTNADKECEISIAVSPEAKQYQGYGTALKPSFEPICLARKPLTEKTITRNVLKWGTGALNIDATRIESGTDHFRTTVKGRRGGMTEADERKGKALGMFEPGKLFEPTNSILGRWPANICHDGSDEVVKLFPDSKGQLASIRGTEPSLPADGNVYSAKYNKRLKVVARNDSGSSARFFYSSKATKKDRANSKHPTVKPVKLKRWLARMITPPNGIILDPFAGSGTTLEAAQLEGFRSVGIELELEYYRDMERRLLFRTPKHATPRHAF